MACGARFVPLVDNLGDDDLADDYVHVSDRGYVTITGLVTDCDLPVHPRRASYLQFRQSDSYQFAIPDRIGGVPAPGVVLSDDTEDQPEQ